MEALLSKKWAAVLGGVLCTLLWGSAYPMIKSGYAALGITSVADRLVFAGVRFVLAGAMVWIVASCRRLSAASVPRRLIPGAVLYGMVQTGLMYLLNYIGVANTSATKTSILTALSAFLAVMFAPLFFKEERITPLKVIGVVIGTLGIIVVNLGDLGGGLSLFGEGFVLLSTLLNTAGSFIGKRISRGCVFEMTAYQLLIGGAFLLATGLVFGGRIPLSVPALLYELYLAFVSAAAFSLWTALLVRHDAGRVLIYNLLIPVFGAMWSLIILGEREILSPVYLLSVVLVAAGIILVNYQRKSKKPL